MAERSQTSRQSSQESSQNINNGGSSFSSASSVDLIRDDVEGNEGRCGYGKCTPTCLQRCHSPKWLLLCMCLMITVQGFVVTGLLGSVITTLERRFHLTSAQSGLISAMYDIGVTVVLVPVTYYGSFTHKGKWLGYGCILLGIGSFIMALPQFTTGPYEVEKSTSKYCSADNVSSSCVDDEGLSIYLYVFLLAQALIGIGSSPMFSLGFVYLDENLKRDSSALYISIYYSVSLLGPALGYLLGGYFLSFHGDMGFVDTESLSITSDDPQWYGAWWLGYIVCALLAFLAALPLLCFAKELPGSATRRQQNQTETHEKAEDSDISQPGFGTSLKDLPASLKNLFKNPTFVFLALCDTFEGFAASGAALFLPKYIENQFGLRPGLASIAAGAVLIPSGGGGAAAGGIIIKRWKLGCKQIMKLGFTVLILSALASSIVLLNCPKKAIAGITAPYLINDAQNWSGICNGDCGCKHYRYDPVCADGRVEYTTPCFAGCTDIVNAMGVNCSCTSTLGSFSNVTMGTCPGTCNLLPLFLIFIFLAIFFAFMAATPTVQGTLRCVPFKQRSLATGVSWIFVRLFGAIPSPLVFGASLDQVCLLWGETCDARSSCQVYSNHKASYILFGLTVGFKIPAIIFMFLAWLLYKPPQVSTPLEAPRNGNIFGKHVPDKQSRALQNGVDGIENKATSL